MIVSKPNLIHVPKAENKDIGGLSADMINLLNILDGDVGMLLNKLILFPVSVPLNVFARMHGIVYVGNAEVGVVSKSNNTDEVRKDIEFYNIPLEEPKGKRILASLQHSFSDM